MYRDNKVCIAGKSGPKQNIKTVLEQLNISSLKGKSVLIKPNVGRAAKPGKGYNTHPEAIAGLIEVLQEVGAKKIAIGESPLIGINTMEAFEISGVADVARKYNVELIDFDATPPVKKEVKNPRIISSTRICAPVYDYDCLISLPVAKTHMHTGVTLGIKNMKGCLYKNEKVRYHQLEYKDIQYADKTLDSAISDLATVLLPDLTVIDGYTGMEGLGPSGGDAKVSDFAVASWHPMGADVLGCILMGIDPVSIPHLRIISERLNFDVNPSFYKVEPANYTEFISIYRNPPKEISMDFPNVVVYDNESCSSCLSTLMLFLRRFKDDMRPYFLDDGNFHIGIGKGIENAKVGTVFVGNCTRKKMVEGIWVPGCPPVPTSIYEAITGFQPDENEPEVK
jgi:uncharacterized protein (DUF362 family)